MVKETAQILHSRIPVLDLFFRQGQGGLVDVALTGAGLPVLKFSSSLERESLFPAMSFVYQPELGAWFVGGRGGQTGHVDAESFSCFSTPPPSPGLPFPRVDAGDTTSGVFSLSEFRTNAWRSGGGDVQRTFGEVTTAQAGLHIAGRERSAFGKVLAGLTTERQASVTTAYLEEQMALARSLGSAQEYRHWCHAYVKFVFVISRWGEGRVREVLILASLSAGISQRLATSHGCE